MVTKKIKIIMTLLSVIMIYSRCKPVMCSDAICYSFKVDSARAYPDKDSIRVGDTLWIEINFPTQLQDNSTNKIIDYSNAGNLGEDIGIAQYADTNPNSVPVRADNNFNYIPIKGKASTIINGIRNFNFLEANNLYSLKVAIVPTETGVYGLGIGNPTGVYRKNDPCTKAAFSFSFSKTNQHFYLNPSYQSGMVLPNSYYFKVY